MDISILHHPFPIMGSWLVEMLNPKMRVKADILGQHLPPYCITAQRNSLAEQQTHS